MANYEQLTPSNEGKYTLSYTGKQLDAAIKSILSLKDSDGEIKITITRIVKHEDDTTEEVEETHVLTNNAQVNQISSNIEQINTNLNTANTNIQNNTNSINDLNQELEDFKNSGIRWDKALRYEVVGGEENE